MNITTRAAEETATPATIISLLDFIFGCVNITVVAIVAGPDVADPVLADIPNAVAVLHTDGPTKDVVSGILTFIVAASEETSGPTGVASARSGARIAALKSLWGQPLF